MPDIPILFVSGYLSEDTDAELQSMLGDDGNFLAKPYTPVTLARRVAEILQAARRAGGDPGRSR